MRSDLTPRSFETEIEIATFHANRSTHLFQNLHGVLFSNGDGHTGLEAFLGVPKGSADFMPKTKKCHWDRKRPRIKKGQE